MAKTFSEKHLEDAMRVGHGAWRIRYPGVKEDYYLRLEKEDLNSEDFILVFSTTGHQAWDIAKGKSVNALMTELRDSLPREFLVFDKLVEH